jgi:hypothetical protein
MTKRVTWNQSFIRLCADIAIEKGVVIRLEKDGAITISPADPDALQQLKDEQAGSGLEKW